MSESREMRPRIRRPAIGLTLVAMTGLAAVCIFARCSGGQSVTPEALAAARKVWAEAEIRDYDLEWSASGITSAHYYVTVRERGVRKVESIASDGQRFEVRPPTPGSTEWTGSSRPLPMNWPSSRRTGPSASRREPRS